MPWSFLLYFPLLYLQLLHLWHLYLWHLWHSPFMASPLFLAQSLVISLTFLFHSPHLVCKKNSVTPAFKIFQELNHFFLSPMLIPWFEPPWSLIWVIALASYLFSLILSLVSCALFSKQQTEWYGSKPPGASHPKGKSPSLYIGPENPMQSGFHFLCDLNSAAATLICFLIQQAHFCFRAFALSFLSTQNIPPPPGIHIASSLNFF